jgi:hypoxanthine phosphoribosyltransferase
MIEIQEILFDARAIDRKVNELAARISKDYEGKDVVLICVLKGAITFTADLMRRLTMPVELDFARAASYGSSTTALGDVSITKDIDADIKDRHVLLVDGIVDSGKTLDCLRRRYAARGPASLKAVVLLDKRSRRTVDVPIEYIGYEIPDRFVVGYGMDFSEKHRSLPYIAEIKGS